MVDVGTGDGQFVVRTAAADRSVFVIGIDTSIAALGRGFTKAHRRGNGDNALFVLGAAESTPHELDRMADEVVVQFPWGSLLEGIVGDDATIPRNLAGMLKPHGTMTIRLSITQRDNRSLPELDHDSATTIGRRFAARATALRFRGAHAISRADVKAMHSAWAKRLAVGAARPGWTLSFEAER